jgi:hypothetical protein
MKYLCFLTCFFLQLHLNAQENKLFSSILSSFKTEINSKCDTISEHTNDFITKGKIDFLNKDFNTNYFSNSKIVYHWQCNSFDSSNSKIDFGIIGMRFKSEKDSKTAMKTIAIANRTNFMLIVYTKFKVVQDKNEIVVFYSETYNTRPDMMRFFENH